MKISRLFNIILAICCLSSIGVHAQDALPEISNIRFSNNLDEQVLTITYDVIDAESDRVEVLLRASFDEGGHFLINTENATGDVGLDIPTGNNLMISWYYGEYWDNVEGKTLRLIADDGYRPDISELVDQVDPDRMYAMLEYICEPRSFQVNTQHLYDVRDTLIDLAGEYGYDVVLQEFQHLGRTATNVIGRKAGLGDESTTYIMDAHYDGNIDAPGADDNGSGVVGFLEAMRILAPYQFDKSIEFIGFDQEEEGLLGSITYAWLGGIESWKRVGGVLNYEMIGYYSDRPNTQEVPFGFDILLQDDYQDLVDNEFRGDFIFTAGNESSVEIVDAFNAAAATYVPELKVISAIVPLNAIVAPDLLRSDHAPFWFKGIPAIMITDGSEFRNHNYHTEFDLIDSLDIDFMRQVAQTGLAALVDLADIRHAAVETFDVSSLVTGGAENAMQHCAVRAYPNPGSDRIRIELGGCLELDPEVSLELRDLSGKVVDSFKLDGFEADLDVSHLACGSYIVRLSTDRGSVSQQIIVH